MGNFCTPRNQINTRTTDETPTYIILRIILSLENLLENWNDRNLADIEELEIEFHHLNMTCQTYFSIIEKKEDKSSEEIMRKNHLKYTRKFLFLHLIINMSHLCYIRNTKKIVKNFRKFISQELDY